MSESDNKMTEEEAKDEGEPAAKEEQNEEKPQDEEPPPKVEEKAEEQEALMEPEHKAVSFDELLKKLGEFGRYQRRVYFLLFLPTIFSAMHKLAWVFLGAQVDHRCRLPQEPENATFQDVVAQEQCSYKTDNDTWTTCDHGYVYDRSTFGSSAVMEYNLVCDMKGMRATAQSIFMAGVLLGSYIFGEMSDKIGRKPTFFLSVGLQIFFGFLAGLVPEYFSFVITRLIIGMTTSGVFLVSYVLAMESVGPSCRVVAGTLCQYYYTFGFFLMAFLAYFLNHDWQLLQLVLTAPTVLFLSYWWIVPESVRWLIRKGRYEEAKKQIGIIAKENKVELPQDMVDNMIEATKKENERDAEKNTTHSVLDLFRYKNLRKKSLTLFFLWFVNSGTYYGLSLGASNLGGNPYINFLLAAAVEIPAYAVNLVLLNNPKVGRRLALCAFMLIAGLALTISIFVPEGMTGLLITLSTLGKLAITTSYGIVYIFTAEQFPTVIRNVGMGASSLSARIGGIICPYINMLGDHWKPLPLIIYGVLAFAGGLLSLLLPETLNKELPETIEDGENFGKEDSSSSNCCRKRHNSHDKEAANKDNVPVNT